MIYYEGKRVAITGFTGFLGAELVAALTKAGAEVYQLAGDVRDPKTFDPVTYQVDYLFHFGAPSSQVLFKRAADACIDATINGMRNAVKACERSGTKLIYPSTGLLSHGGSNEYARAKKICEDLAAGSQADILGVRPFGTFGPGEEKKRDFASVPYLFMREMMDGRAPVIYGDGTQRRDFIYIDDTVQAIIHLAELKSGGVVDIGSGQPVQFNGLCKLIAKELGAGIQPELTGNLPASYIDETGADISELKKYYTPKVDLREGIKRMVEHELERRRVKAPWLSSGGTGVLPQGGRNG